MSVFRIPAIIAALVLVPAALVYLAAGYESPRNLVALMAGVAAFSLMAFNLLLAARLPGAEAMLGGLDQVYRLHKWSGIAILFLVLVHTQVRFVQLEGLVPPGSLAETAVELAKPAFMLLVVLLVLSAVKRVPFTRAELPWMWWRVTHWLIIPIFLVLGFHQMFVKAPFDSMSAIRLWLNLAALLGTGAIIWIIVAPWLRKRSYEIVGVTRLEGATELRARPLRRPIGARAGQFAFLSAAQAGLREPHPFTVSHLSDSGEIGFAIQPAGDFTRRLRDTLAPGDRLRLEGGYGRFDFRRGGQYQIWLAGGIGITPFLAMAEAYAKDPGTRQIVLVHAVRHAGLAINADRLQDIAAAHPGFHWQLHDSAAQGRLDAGKLAEYARFPLRDAELWYCGPKGLRKALQTAWRAQGDGPRRVHYEEFEFR